MFLKNLIGVFLLSTMINVSAFANFDHSHGIWNKLAQDHVHMIQDGQASQVDYQSFLQQRKVLHSYLSQLSAVSPQEFSTWSKSQRLAFLINAYNAYTVELILTGYPKLQSIKDLGSLFKSPWKKEFVPLLGKTRSLDDIEHGMIRKVGDYNEPRIHFAVNCASIGCPALLNEAFTGDKLEQQLEAVTHAFLRDRTRNRYNARTGRVEISKIFDWYSKDFERGWGGWHKFDQFLAQYADSLTDTPQAKQRLLAGGTRVKYLNYDWKLNGTR